MTAVPTVDEVLTLVEIEPLHRPILLVGLTGWFDAGGVATTAWPRWLRGTAR